MKTDLGCCLLMFEGEKINFPDINILPKYSIYQQYNKLYNIWGTVGCIFNSYLQKASLDSMADKTVKMCATFEGLMGNSSGLS